MEFWSSGLPLTIYVGQQHGNLSTWQDALPFFYADSTVLLELSGSIDAVASLSGTLFQNEFTELAGLIAAESIVGKKIAGTDYTSDLTFYISLAGSMSAVSGITETAFLGLDVYHDLALSIASKYEARDQFQYIDPAKPTPKFWENVVTPGDIPWSDGDEANSFWREIAPSSLMDWNPQNTASQFWRHILKNKDKSWDRTPNVGEIENAE